ncbi:hypothetical protein D9619_004763 [Psilocybe cf. subviscida]|uniref:Uncharacterized protein n=1 Tax=Psilocybe cf. subviscida TaxID=2480587 RepID=A0A8H5F8M4_9AGAR|nr:hypothetical protein D9619_004763 [Psilocybe cf. subviscida]
MPFTPPAPLQHLASDGVNYPKLYSVTTNCPSKPLSSFLTIGLFSQHPRIASVKFFKHDHRIVIFIINISITILVLIGPPHSTPIMITTALPSPR